MNNKERAQNVFTTMQLIRGRLEANPNINSFYLTNFNRSAYGLKSTEQVSIVSFGFPIENLLGTNMVAYRGRRLRLVDGGLPVEVARTGGNVFPLNDQLEVHVHRDRSTLYGMNVLAVQEPHIRRACQTIYSFNAAGQHLKLVALPIELKDPLHRIAIATSEILDHRMVVSEMEDDDWELAQGVATFLAKNAQQSDRRRMQ